MAQKSLLNAWFLASRPKTLSAAAAPVFMGTALAAGDGKYHWGAALSALFGAIMIQIGTNFANDYFDWKKGADTVDRKGPLRVTQSGLLPPDAVRRAYILFFGLAAVAGLFLIARAGWIVAAIGALSIAAGILYTGGPRPYGYAGLGEFFVLAFFGYTAVAGTYFVQALALSWPALVAGTGPGLLSTAILSINNLRDRETDIKAGKRTLAVRFGAEFARLEYLACLVGAALMPVVLVVMQNGRYWALLAIPALITSIPAAKTVMSTEDGPPLNQALAATGRTLFLYSLLFSMGWIL